MKKISIAIIVLLASLTVVTARLYDKSFGDVGTATTSPVQIIPTGQSANTVSLFNNGANTIFALVNCDPADLTAAIAAGTAVPIPAGASFDWDSKGQTSISKLCIATSSGTSAYFMGAW